MCRGLDTGAGTPSALTGTAAADRREGGTGAGEGVFTQGHMQEDEVNLHF